MADRVRRMVVGVGNEYRRDDGFGPAVVAELARRQPDDARLSSVGLSVIDGEATRLLELWTGADLAVVVDVVRDAADRAGHRYELVQDELDGHAEDRSASSHGIGLGSAVALGRVLERLPRRLVVLAVCGVDFGFGTGFTPEVAAAVEPVARRACELVGGPV